MTEALDIIDRGRTVIGKLDPDDFDRGFELMAPWPEPTHMRQRRRQANRAVAAHAEIADIVEENDAGCTGGVVRLAKKRADHRIVAARLVNGIAAEMVEIRGEAGEPFLERAAANGGPPSTITRVGSPSVWELQ